MFTEVYMVTRSLLEIMSQYMCALQKVKKESFRLVFAAVS